MIKGPFKYLPTLLNTSGCEIPTLLYTRSVKKVPLSVEPPRIGHYRSTPSPREPAAVRLRKLEFTHRQPKLSL